MDIQPITHLTLDLLRPILDESLAEGYGFIQKLWDEYQSGKMTFCEDGAVLLGGYDEGRLIAIGGVHTDTYLDSPTIGRIRHVYVLREYRRHGVGKKLVQGLIDHASNHYTVLTLRTLTDHGDAFYKSLGFSTEPHYENATHAMQLR
jgi:GNAT superfamily N-acetyltransferase